VFKRIISYMKITDVMFLFLLVLAYLMVKSDIKDLQQFGFFAFIGVFALYISNVIFRHSLTAYVELKKQRKEEAEAIAKKNELIALRAMAIKKMEQAEQKSSNRTTKRLQNKQRSKFNRIA